VESTPKTAPSAAFTAAFSQVPRRYWLNSRLLPEWRLPPFPSPPSSLQKSPAHTADHGASSTAVTHGGKNYPSKNVPHWSPLHRKLQEHSTTPHSPTAGALHTDTDSPTSNSTEVEPAPKDSTVPIVERPEISPEIPETPAAALEDMRRKEDNNSDDGNAPSLRSHASTETVEGDSVVAGNGDLEAE
jgi:hypothetical protein